MYFDSPFSVIYLLVNWIGSHCWNPLKISMRVVRMFYYDLVPQWCHGSPVNVKKYKLIGVEIALSFIGYHMKHTREQGTDGQTVVLGPVEILKNELHTQTPSKILWKILVLCISSKIEIFSPYLHHPPFFLLLHHHHFPQLHNPLQQNHPNTIVKEDKFYATLHLVANLNSCLHISNEDKRIWIKTYTISSSRLISDGLLDIRTKASSSDWVRSFIS